MMGGMHLAMTRHYFPGNNTPQGFYSYYNYILGQREANRIICLKGGPGTGKSTFLKKIAGTLEGENISVDYLHCSADENSLDGILIPDKNIALVDGTSPHVIDPKTPGAVDTILNFGDFWNDRMIGEEKEKIIKHNEACSRWYRIGYGYLQAAGAVGKNLSMIQEEGIETSELYGFASDVIHREYRGCDISMKPGRIKKFFATAITPYGFYNSIKSILSGIRKVYLINVPEGYRNQSIMQLLLEGAKYRGLDVWCYYCPMGPEDKIEHLVIPQLSLAFVTINKWHDVEPWELSDVEGNTPEITYLDVCDYQSYFFTESNRSLIAKLSAHYEDMLKAAVYAFSKAKENHDAVEGFYTGTMDFEAVNRKAKEILDEILG